MSNNITSTTDRTTADKFVLPALTASAAVVLAYAVLVIAGGTAADGPAPDAITVTDKTISERHVVEEDRVGVESTPTLTVSLPDGTTDVWTVSSVSYDACAVGETATRHDTGAVTCG